MASSDQPPTLFVIGGYGKVGLLVIEELLKSSKINVVIAGPDLVMAKNRCLEFSRLHRSCQFTAVEFDVLKPEDYALITEHETDVVINCAGPFQAYDYQLPEFCAQHQIHYLDTALSREYICGIYQLDKLAKQNNVSIICGCGVLPSLTMTVIDAQSKNFAALDKIEICYHPETRQGLGLATTRSILSMIGQPFECIEHGKKSLVYGAQNLHRRYFGDNIGIKWQSNFNTAELELLPKRFNDIHTLHAYIGTRPKYFDWLFWGLSWLRRANIVSNFGKLPKHICKYFFSPRYGQGSSKAVIIRLTGTDNNYQPLKITWSMIAEKGEGNYLSAITCSITLKKLLQGKYQHGAYPSISLYSLDELDNALEGHAVYHMQDVFHD